MSAQKLSGKVAVATGASKAIGAAIAEDKFQSFASLTPLGRFGQPDDIAPAVVFLASPEAGWITGETL